MEVVFMLIMKVIRPREKSKSYNIDQAVELAPFRPARHRMGRSYIKAYFRHFPVSLPEEDQDDRNALYCL